MDSHTARLEFQILRQTGRRKLGIGIGQHAQIKLRKRENLAYSGGIDALKAMQSPNLWHSPSAQQKRNRSCRPAADNQQAARRNPHDAVEQPGNFWMRTRLVPVRRKRRERAVVIEQEIARACRAEFAEKGSYTILGNISGHRSECSFGHVRFPFAKRWTSKDACRALRATQKDGFSRAECSLRQTKQSVEGSAQAEARCGQEQNKEDAEKGQCSTSTASKARRQKWRQTAENAECPAQDLSRVQLTQSTEPAPESLRPRT